MQQDPPARKMVRLFSAEAILLHWAWLGLNWFNTFKLSTTTFWVKNKNIYVYKYWVLQSKFHEAKLTEVDQLILLPSDIFHVIQTTNVPSCLWSFFPQTLGKHWACVGVRATWNQLFITWRKNWVVHYKCTIGHPIILLWSEGEKFKK